MFFVLHITDNFFLKTDILVIVKRWNDNFVTQYATCNIHAFLAYKLWINLTYSITIRRKCSGHIFFTNKSILYQRICLQYSSLTKSQIKICCSPVLINLRFGIFSFVLSFWAKSKKDHVLRFYASRFNISLVLAEKLSLENKRIMTVVDSIFRGIRGETYSQN